VQALEEVIAERFAMGHDPRAYWREQDAGIHVFAVALYSKMKTPLRRERGVFPRFPQRMFREGKFSKGKIEQLNQAFFNRRHVAVTPSPPLAKTSFLCQRVIYWISYYSSEQTISSLWEE